MWILLSLLFSMPVSARDLTGLYFDIGSYDINGAFSQTIDVEIVVKDPLGRQAGKNPFTGESFTDIPNVGVGIDSIDDDETGQPGPESMEYSIVPAISGQYTLTIFGISNNKYYLSIRARNSVGTEIIYANYDGYSFIGSTNSYVLKYDSTPGAFVPVIAPIITFDRLRNDILVAQEQNDVLSPQGAKQLGDEKFVNNLIRLINLAEKLDGACDRRKAKKDKCEPAVNVLKLFLKRLELASRKCDKPANCDEEREWTAFRKVHGKDDDYRDFFRDWDRDDWHKHKRQSRRFVTDEALKIIKDDAGWLIKSLGGEMDKRHDEHHGNDKNGRQPISIRPSPSSH